MRIAVMQPYIFPYIGYFQLVHASDVFVFYDDVNYINKGWINRNRILVNGKDQMITVPCKEASQNKLIKDVMLFDDPVNIKKLLATITMAYKKAPCFNEAFPIIEKTLNTTADISISELAINSVLNVCDYLGLEKTFKISSQTYNNRELKKADRLIDICHIEGITEYVNAAGGREIYSKEYYGEKGLNLDFLISDKVEYSQFSGIFVPWLSIIDIMMFESKENIVNKILPSYHLE